MAKVKKSSKADVLRDAENYGLAVGRADASGDKAKAREYKVTYDKYVQEVGLGVATAAELAQAFDRGNRRGFSGKGADMASKRKTVARRKAAEEAPPEDVQMDLTNEGNEEELKDEVPFEPKPSMVAAGKAYGNLKAIKDAFGPGGEEDLEKMDNDGMRLGLKDLMEKDIEELMGKMKDLVHQHHGESYKMEPDELMEKLCKSLESIESGEPSVVMHSVDQIGNDQPSTVMHDLDDVDKDDSFEQGEANLVDGGVIPEGDLEPLDDEGKGLDDEDEKQHGSDEDTEEILERYQNPKTLQWSTRVVGKAWRAKNGRIYCQLEKGLNTIGKAESPVGQVVTISSPHFDSWVGVVSGVEGGILLIRNSRTGKTIKVDPGRGDVTVTSRSGLALGRGEKSLRMKTGNPAELDAPTDSGAIIKAAGDAADHLEAAASDEATPPMHKSAHSYHAAALRKALDDMGNPAELKDDMGGAVGGTDLTEGVSELKDLDEEDPTKGRKSLSPNVSRVLAELKAGNDELKRKARMYGIPLNGN